ncbi:hypothetical protein BS78_07G200200 [Paspalum vaginatum]|nr:hypothetical protein BS78_07G200200 [Paspalum vaginatum]
MEKKTAPKGEGGPRKPKALRLDPQAPATPPPPEVSDPMEEGAEGTRIGSGCDHRLTDSARKNLVLSLLSVDAGKCVGCQLEDKMGLVKRRPLESAILMCLQCGQHFCCGVGGIDYPFGHSRAHAWKNQHWVGALYDDAARGYCFKCNSEVEMPVELEPASVRPRREGTGVNKLCDHVPAHRVDREILSLSDEKCDFCGRTGYTSKIMMCMGCGWHICAGHAPDHAKKNDHWFAVLFKSPEVGYCFKCEAEVDVDSGKILAECRASEFGMVPGHVKGSDSVVPRVMGDARPRAGEADKSSWDAIAPRLPTVVDDKLEWELYDKCYHMPSEGTYKLILGSSLLLDAAGTKCQGCQNKDQLVGSFIFVCLECGWRSCGDLGSYLPTGHVQDHAKLERHWVSVMSSDLQTGFCYMCEISVLMYSDSVEMDSEEEGYAIKGIPNCGNTCYVSAMVQCLLALDKLQARMLGPDPPPGDLGRALKELFVEASTAHAGGGMLNPDKLLRSVRFHADKFKGNMMHDSYELLNSLCDALHNEENGIETVIDSVFRGELSETRTCLCCQSSSVVYDAFCDLSLALPSNKSLKSQPKKDASQLLPENESNSVKIEEVAKSIDSHLIGSELCDVVVEKTPEPLVVDSAEAQRIWQRKDVIQDPLLTQEDEFARLELPEGFTEVPLNSVSYAPRTMSDVKVEQKIGTTTDSHCPEDMRPPLEVSIEANGNIYTAQSTEEEGKSVLTIEDCLSLFFEGVTVERSCDCSKVAEEPSTNQSGNNNLVAISTNTAVDGGQTEQSQMTTCPNEQPSELNSMSVEYKCSSSSEQDSSDAESEIIQAMDTNTDRTDSKMSCGDKEYECHDGNQEAVSNLLRAQHSQILTTPNQDRSNQQVPDLSANQLGDNQNEQKRSDRARQIPQITKLPPVLTLHLKRYIQDGQNFHKNEAHVNYKEYLDVRPFMDTSSMDRGSSIYHLAGVVEHHGGSMNSGHYVAYVRARRLGNQQQRSSCSSSWFCADDKSISQVTLEEVLKRKAYVLFYERIEG